MTNRKVRGKDSESWRKNVAATKNGNVIWSIVCLHDRCVDDAFPTLTRSIILLRRLKIARNVAQNKNESLMLKLTAAIKNTP